MAIVERKNRDGSKSFQVKVKDSDGNWFPTPSFRRRELAEDEERRLEGLKRKGALAFSQDAKTMTTDEYWEVWRIENRSEVSEGWKISQDQMYRDYLKPLVGEKRMIEVDTPLIGKALRRMQDMGLSAQMRKHVYTLARKMFGDAVDYYEMLAVNPVKPKFHRPKVAETQRSFLFPAQAWQLLGQAKLHRYLGPAVWLQTLAALRPEAVQALDWNSVHWDLNQILICRAWKQKVGKLEEYPKGKDWEYVPMPPALKDYLAEIWEGRGRPREGFVCLSIKGGMLPYETYLHALRRLCRSAGVPVVTPHELRHTCTEIYVQAGASAEDLRRLLNHASLSATKRYIHRTDERLSSIAGSIENFQGKFPTGKKEAESGPIEGVENVH